MNEIERSFSIRLLNIWAINRELINGGISEESTKKYTFPCFFSHLPLSLAKFWHIGGDANILICFNQLAICAYKQERRNGQPVSTGTEKNADRASDAIVWV